MLATDSLAKAYNNCSNLDERFDKLYLFYEKAVASKYSNFTKSDHLKRLSEELTKLTNGEFNNLCIAMPPRHSKSSMVTLAYPLWLIMNDPNSNILIINAEQSLSEKFGIDLKDILNSIGCLKDIYLSDVKHSNTHFKFEDSYGNLYRGSVKLVGINGNYTGHDADYIIIDDPYKGFEDITPTLLQKKIDLFKTKILQRREPHTKLIICHTRWHTNDLQGYLHETSPEDYTFLEFPAILKNDIPLWENRFSLSFLKQQMKEMGERLFSSIYQQQPLDETGDFFQIDNLFFTDNYDPNTSHIISKCRSWDFAYSNEEKGDVNDYTSGVYMYRTYDDRYVLSDIVYGQFGDDLINKVKQTAKRDTPSTPILIETGTKGGASKFLFDEYRKKLMGYTVKQSEPIGTKVDRATPLKNLILDGKVGITIINDKLRGRVLEQLKSFPLGRHDDIVDSMSYAVSYLQNKGTMNTVGVSGTNKRRFRR